MDIVIPLGKGSRWHDNELRFSLRSVAEHLSGYNRIVIVGEKPDWLRNVMHIREEDVHRPKMRDFNIFKKIVAACMNPAISEDFLFMNDDHFMLQDYDVSKFPYYHGGLLTDHILQMRDTMPYKNVIINTLWHLAENGKRDPLHFDLHCPIVYNKQRFLDTITRDWPSYGYAIKSMYCNINHIVGEFSDDLKFTDVPTAQDIYKKLLDRKWFSIGDVCLRGDMRMVLRQLYPNKSIFES